MRNRKFFFALSGLIFCVLAVYFVYDFVSKKNEYLPYSQFYKAVEEGSLKSVTFDGENLYFSYKDDEGKSYKTQNPQSPSLKEELLKQDVEVKVQTDGGQIISTIFDIIFYAFFIGVILFVFRKFIDPNSFKVVHKTGVKFDDIVGMDSLKKDMVQIMNIMKNPAQYANKGVRLPKGLLLEGAPGNGKTLFAKALAGEAKINFIPAKATDFESMFMAIGPMKVKLLFRKARRCAPCIVFIDEFDGIGTTRNYTGSALETENTRIVTALLNELDGFEASKGVLVIAATNSIKALDPALIRPGRFDAKLTVPYPDSDSRAKLIEMYTREIGRAHV